MTIRTIDDILNSLEARSFFIERTEKKQKRPKKHYKTAREDRNAPLRVASLGPEKAALKAAEDRRKDATINGMYRHMKKACTRKQEKYVGREDKLAAWQWEISKGDWYLMWLECPNVMLDTGVYVPAWTKRGRDMTTDVQLNRVDTTKPWTIDNLTIVYKGEVIWKAAELR